MLYCNDKVCVGMATSLFSSANGIRFNLPLLPDVRSLVFRYSVTVVYSSSRCNELGTDGDTRARLNSVAKVPKHIIPTAFAEAHLQQSHTHANPRQ